jgi:uroporphyrinogen III methyltransferase/synthase
MKSGFVALVGAGPGDRGLLTLRGKELLLQADVVVYDRLVSEDIIRMIPDTAEMINVGKENRYHPVRQEEINEILLQKAMEGYFVVRLKGGDPFVFGRGGEELELLQENNISFEIVPGITSAVAALCYAGIPVTHRDFCSSFHVITGHARAGGELEIPFKELIELKGTLIFLMGVSSLAYLMEGLLNAGMSADMPAAVVENGTRPNQRRLTATVGTIEEKAAGMGLQSPAIIAVGRVCDLWDRFDWYMGKPLFGKKILVTRPKTEAGTLSAKLYGLGAEPVEFPCIQVAAIPDNKRLYQACENLGGYDWLLFTSKNGVDIFFDYLDSRGKDARVLANTRIGVVGVQTEKALRRKGVFSDYIPEIYDGRHLAEGVAALVKDNGKVLICDAEIAGDDMVDLFKERDIPYDRIPLYHTVYINENSEQVRNMITSGEIRYITFTSASTVEGFFKAIGEQAAPTLTAVCIGQQTAQAAAKYGIRHVVARQATIDSMIEKILEVAGNDKQTKETQE